MRQWFLTLELIDSPILGVLCAIVVALAVVIAWPAPRHPWRWLIALVAGCVGGFLLAVVAEALGAFDGPLPDHAALWIGAGSGFAVAGLVVAFTRPWWRGLLAVVMAVAALMAAALGVNSSYGLTHTPAAVFGIQALDDLPLPALTTSTDDPATLYATWAAPANLPATSRVSALSGEDRIPAEGYSPRDAALYLPPAALVANPPRLPLIVFMMGQPGTPDPTSIAAALDRFAAAHNGLAPIAIVADQLGAIDRDPACHDSATYGAVSTYFTTDIPAWAVAHLNVTADRSFWVIGGYSNGGSCAFTWGAQNPQIWGNVMDISGNEYPGSEHVQQTIDEVFAGDAAAFQAASPSAALVAHAGQYAGHVAVFTHGDQDTVFGPGQISNAGLATDARFTVFSDTIAGAGHGGEALDAGLDFALDSLAPRLGLAPPAS